MMGKRTTQRGVRWLAASLLAAGIAGQAMAANGTPAQATRPAPTAPKKKKIVVKSPGEIATQLSVILRNGKTPWQLYPTYVSMFQRFAERQARVPAATKEAQDLRKRMVAHYQGMAKLLQQMQECAAVRDGIKQNRTDIPYSEAGKKQKLLLQQFMAMGSRLPGFKMPPAAAPTVRRAARK
jgi:hypothetical protein